MIIRFSFVLALLAVASGVQAQSPSVDELLRRSAPSQPAGSAVIQTDGSVVGRNIVIPDRSPAPTPTPQAQQQTAAPLSPPPVAAASPSPSPARFDPEMIPDRRKWSPVWKIDPLSPIVNADQMQGTPYEATSLLVNRTFYAVEPDPENASKPKWTSKIPISIPVVYKSRTLVWKSEDIQNAKRVLARLESLQKKSEEVKAESDALIREWSELVRKGIPEAVLMADSPSIPSNQGVSEILRGTPVPGFEPGSGVSIKISK